MMDHNEATDILMKKMVRNDILFTPFTKQPQSYNFNDSESNLIVVCPGDIVVSQSGFMRGHGTYTNSDNDVISSVAGSIQRVNRLICVQSLKSRYDGKVGDVIIGRISHIAVKRWKVDTNSKLLSTLLLSSVNLPGGELRRRSEEDERMMRNYLREGDLISAEVQSVMVDGSLSLHTRSLKYGKLGQGVFLKVSPSLIKRRKNHFHNLPCGATVIIGNNGFIWICPISNDTEEGDGGFVQSAESIPLSDRETIARIRNCILCLAKYQILLYDTSIMYAFEESQKFFIPDILKDDICKEIVQITAARLEYASNL